MMRWILSVLLTGSIAYAQKEGIMSRLFAPGPLILGHENLEGAKDCLKCHETGQGIPDSKCNDCHKEIRKVIELKQGYHGNLKESCIKCHADHKGRAFESASIDPKKFDHELTGFSLLGKHSKIECAECHKDKRGNKRTRPRDPKYFGSSATCKSCHAKEDIHFFKNDFQNKDCNTCHGVESWKKQIRFDHKKDGKFELVGHHAELKCQDCHNPESRRPQVSTYKWPHLADQKCLACHTNFHKKTLQVKYQDGNCTVCHDQTKWKIEKFDHRVTRYPLREKHAEIECLECHKQKSPAPLADIDKQGHQKLNVIWKGLKTDCLSCHSDFHKFGPIKSQEGKPLNRCLDCHNERDWKEIRNFNHNANTRFTIDGEHQKLKCKDCHLPEKKAPFFVLGVKFGLYHWNKLQTKTCEVCHRSPHTKVFTPQLLAKKCTECHVTGGWKVVKTGQNFDHGKTRFPLTGRHTKATCTECHVKNKQQIFRWNSIDKGFCLECHDNVHRGQFSGKFAERSCRECHTTEKFMPTLKFDHDQTQYPLRGSHKDLKCTSCHTETSKVFPVKPPQRMHQFTFPDLKAKECLTCHQDVHKGQLGTKCVQCHNDNKWKPAKFDHQTQARFPLKGKHENVKCVDCHKPIKDQVVKEFAKTIPVTLYKPINTQCLTCHKDAHNGHFGAQCVSCHSESSWKVTKDFHKNFSLTGVHFTLQCQECHAQGRKLSGLSQQCLFCHKKDDVHLGSLPQCGECHSQQFWENTKFNHSLTTFPLRGAHRVLTCVECHSRGIYQGLSGDCVSCHLSDAQSATTFSHTPIGNFSTCTDCHKNQFSFRSSQ